MTYPDFSIPEKFFGKAMFNLHPFGDGLLIALVVRSFGTKLVGRRQLHAPVQKDNVSHDSSPRCWYEDGRPSTTTCAYTHVQK